MINIAYIIDSLQIVGAEKMLFLTLKKLNREKYHASVYALFAGGPIADEIRDLGIYVNVLNLNKLNIIPSFLKLAISLSKNRIKIA